MLAWTCPGLVATLGGRTSTLALPGDACPPNQALLLSAHDVISTVTASEMKRRQMQREAPGRRGGRAAGNRVQDFETLRRETRNTCFVDRPRGPTRHNTQTLCLGDTAAAKAHG